MDLSLVIPVYNEADNLRDLSAEIRQALDGTGLDYEIVAVDDGSTDGSYAILSQLHQEDPRFRVVRFRRNFGQTAAMAAGFKLSQGDVLVTLDADLQNDPGDIPLLLQKLDEGSDIVSGWRKDRQDPFFTRRLPSAIANGIISRVTGVPLRDYGCTLKAYRREVIRNIQLYGDMHRFIPALASAVGASVVEVPVSHRPRTRGKSKYGLSRTLRVLLDLLTVKFLQSYSTRPIHLFGVLGFLLTAGGFVTAAWLSFAKVVFKQPLADRPLFLVAIFAMLVGVQFITLGLLGELLIRIYYESQAKPTYLIRETRGIDVTETDGFSP